MAEGIRDENKPCGIGQVRDVFRVGINNPGIKFKIFERFFKCLSYSGAIPCQVNGFTGRNGNPCPIIETDLMGRKSCQLNFLPAEALYCCFFGPVWVAYGVMRSFFLGASWETVVCSAVR